MNLFFSSSEGQEWYNGSDDHFRAVAEYDFEAEGEDELSFQKGQHITIAPKGLYDALRDQHIANTYNCLELIM